MRKDNLPNSRYKTAQLIKKLFPYPDALYTKTVSLPDGRQFVEIWDGDQPGGLLRMGGLTQAQMRYILARIRDPLDTSVNDIASERVLCQRLDMLVRGVGHTTAPLMRYVAPPPEDREPLNPHLAAQYKKRGRPRGSSGALRGERHTRDQEEPKRPRGRPRTRPLPDPDQPRRPRGRPRKTIDQMLDKIPWYSELVGGGE